MTWKLHTGYLNNTLLAFLIQSEMSFFQPRSKWMERWALACQIGQNHGE